MTKKNITITIVTIVIVLWLVTGIKMYNKNSNSITTISSSSTASNVSIVSGKQEITLTVWPWYNPKISTAKADMPTVLKVVGKNAYWCESAVRIPELKYAVNLEPKGTDTVDLWIHKAGDTINGTCGMGMYNFQIKFN